MKSIIYIKCAWVVFLNYIIMRISDRPLILGKITWLINNSDVKPDGTCFYSSYNKRVMTKNNSK